MTDCTNMNGRSRSGAAVFIAAVVFYVAVSIASPTTAAARRAALSASWSGLQSDLLDWPSDQFGFRSYIGPFGENLYLNPGIAVAHDPGRDITSVEGSLNLHYLLPAGDRLVVFLEGGVAGVATRIDVLDFTEDDLPAKDRTTYIRGGFQAGAGIDIALGGNWSVTAALRGTFLSDIDTRYLERNGSTVTISENPSYWELPRIAIVYWY